MTDIGRIINREMHGKSLIDVDNKVIYFWSPKCACCTIRFWYIKVYRGIKDINIIHRIDALPSMFKVRNMIKGSLIKMNYLNIERYCSFGILMNE